MLPEGFGIVRSGIAVNIRLEQGSDAPQTSRTSPQVGLPEGFRYGGNIVQRYRSPICNVSRGESGFRPVMGSVLEATALSMIFQYCAAVRSTLNRRQHSSAPAPPPDRLTEHFTIPIPSATAAPSSGGPPPPDAPSVTRSPPTR